MVVGFIVSKDGDIKKAHILRGVDPEGGKRISHGQALTRIFTEEEEVMTVIEKAILLFKDEGIAGERFADTVKRLGFEYVNEKLIG